MIASAVSEWGPLITTVGAFCSAGFLFLLNESAKRRERRVQLTKEILYELVAEWADIARATSNFSNQIFGEYRSSTKEHLTTEGKELLMRELIHKKASTLLPGARALEKAKLIAPPLLFRELVKVERRTQDILKVRAGHTQKICRLTIQREIDPTLAVRELSYEEVAHSAELLAITIPAKTIIRTLLTENPAPQDERDYRDSLEMEVSRIWKSNNKLFDEQGITTIPRHTEDWKAWINSADQP